MEHFVPAPNRCFKVFVKIFRPDGTESFTACYGRSTKTQDIYEDILRAQSHGHQLEQMEVRQYRMEGLEPRDEDYFEDDMRATD